MNPRFKKINYIEVKFWNVHDSLISVYKQNILQYLLSVSKCDNVTLLTFIIKLILSIYYVLGVKCVLYVHSQCNAKHFSRGLIIIHMWLAAYSCQITFCKSEENQ